MSGKRLKRSSNSIDEENNWKMEQIKDPDDRDGISEILSLEIEKDLEVLEKRLKGHSRKRPNQQ